MFLPINVVLLKLEQMTPGELLICVLSPLVVYFLECCLFRLKPCWCCHQKYHKGVFIPVPRAVREIRDFATKSGLIDQEFKTNTPDFLSVVSPTQLEILCYKPLLTFDLCDE